MESTMTPDENFIVAIITQAIVDSAYTGISKRKLDSKKKQSIGLLVTTPNM